MLLSGAAASLGPTGFLPAQVASSLPVVPVPFHLPGADSPPAAVALPPGARSLDGILRPGGGSEVDRISVGNTTEDLWLKLTWETLPQGAASDLSVFDEAGRLLADTTPVAGANSLVIELRGPISIPDSVLFVEARIIEPIGAGGAPIEGASYHLQIASEPVMTGLVGAEQGTSAADPVAMGTTGKTSRTPVSLPHWHPQSVAGAISPGADVTSGTAGVDFVSDVSPSWFATARGLVAGSEGTGIATEASPGVDVPVDVSPLPASSYEAAGGIFGVEGGAARDDRSDETRVEMSLVRIASPGPEGSPEEVWSPDRNPINRPDVTGPGSPDDLAVRAGVASPDRSGQPGGELPWLVSAILLPVDRDRPATAGIGLPRRATSGNAGEGDSWDGPGGTIALGVSGAAVLGVALYAPDVTAAMHRARLRPRSGAAGRREGQNRD